MAKAPAFQFYVRDWHSSGRVALMTPAEEGAYIRLLAYCWDSGDCSLPDDDEKLAALSRLGEGWFKGGSSLVRKCFEPHPEKSGYLTNERLFREHQQMLEWRAKSARGGIESGRIRRKASKKKHIKRAEPHLKGGCDLVEPNANTASSSATASSLEKTTPLPPALDTPKFRSAFDSWVAHRKAKKKPATPQAQAMALKKLEGWGEERAVAAIEHSVANGWDGIFEPQGGAARPAYGRAAQAESYEARMMADAFGGSK